MAQKEQNSDWIYYMIGLLTGMLIVISITWSFLWILLGPVIIIVLIKAAVFNISSGGTGDVGWWNASLSGSV
ncbi:MAG: hypothetical protein EOO89_14640, partial [Pedobacter sp.]